MERSLVPSMDASKPSTHANLEAAFGGESMANRKYLFFADVAKLFRDTAAQETEHAFAHFRLLHPELVVSHPEQLNDEEKQAILSRCLDLAVEGETYEYTTMYPEFAAQARQDRDSGAEAEFAEQSSESKEHAGQFRTAAKNFGLLTPIEQHHAETYGVVLKALHGKGKIGKPIMACKRLADQAQAAHINLWKSCIHACVFQNPCGAQCCHQRLAGLVCVFVVDMP